MSSRLSAPGGSGSGGVALPASTLEIVDPTPHTWQWVNQETATAWDSPGRVGILTPNILTDHARLRVKAPLATPYRVKARMHPTLIFDGVPSAGLLLRESSTGRFWSFGINKPTSGVISVYSTRWNNPTSVDGHYTNSEIAGYAPFSAAGFWMQLVDDGSGISVSFSGDGLNYINVLGNSRTNFMASGPDQIGFFVNSNSTWLPAGITISSWKEEAL